MFKSVNLALRRFVPSVSKLTYNPAFAILLSLFDIVPGKLFQEFKKLPPNRMRARVGVGNRLFANQVMYLIRGYPMWMYALARGYVALTVPSLKSAAASADAPMSCATSGSMTCGSPGNISASTSMPT